MLYLKSNCQLNVTYVFLYVISQIYSSVFICKSMSHRELTFLKGIESESKFLFLHVDVQLFQYCLLK